MVSGAHTSSIATLEVILPAAPKPTWMEFSAAPLVLPCPTTVFPVTVTVVPTSFPVIPFF